VVAAAQRAQTFGALCTEFGISRPTGYLWLRRYKELGVRGIAEQSRRPRSSPRRTDAGLKHRVLQVRLRYPDCGARKLRVVLSREGVELPRNTIHHILLRHGLVREQDQRLPAVQRFERQQPKREETVIRAECGVSALVHATPGATGSRFAGRSANSTLPITMKTTTSVKSLWTP
jgi:hypothetical protein